MQNNIYEFSEDQNKLFAKLARLMKYTAVLFIFLGVIIGVFCGFTIVKHPIRGGSYLILTILSIVFGVWTNGVSYAFKQIVETSDNDIDILTDALKVLKQVYALQLFCVVVIILLLLIILILNSAFGYHTITIFNAQ